jgi:hypothetical protein
MPLVQAAVTPQWQAQVLSLPSEVPGLTRGGVVQSIAGSQVGDGYADVTYNHPSLTIFTHPTMPTSSALLGTTVKPEDHKTFKAS